MAIVSPCVAACVLDPESGRCLGCLRSLDEIACWASMSEAERETVMRNLPARRAGRLHGDVQAR